MQIDNPNKQPPILLAYPFRPFFLLTGVYGAVLVLVWIGILFGHVRLPLAIAATQWHGHEMIFGLVPAAIAGFLLTALTAWTGALPLRGPGLLALVLLWLAGRVAMWLSGLLPLWLVALVDLAFLPAMAIYVTRVLLAFGNRRNTLLVVMLGLLTVANALMHASFLGWLSIGRLDEVLALNLITVIVVVIAGRITPAFTGNWLRLNGGDPARVHQSATLDKLTVAATVAMVPADLVTGWPAVGGAVALLAAFANGLRLSGWGGIHALREPLLWVLHLGYAFLVVALFLKGLTPFVDGLMDTAWLHALGVGAIGILILGVMTRVSLGHTGRPLKLPRGAVLIYFAIVLSALGRLWAALGGDYRGGLMVAAVAWAVAFALFTVLYWPVLSRPRVDGRPG